MLARLRSLFDGRTDIQFQSLLEQHVANTMRCASELWGLFSHNGSPNELAAKIVELERTGDDLTREVHLLMDRVFITRFDKEDLAYLVNELDQIIDKMREAAESELAYPRAGTHKAAEQLAIVIQDIVTLVRSLIHDLLREPKPKIQRYVAAIKDKEEEADDIRRNALKELYILADAKSFIAWRDVLGKLEQVTDHCQNVADIVSSMSRK